jgi:hypothetical protein
MYGVSASTLEADDMMAISRQYPSASFASLNVITGLVQSSGGVPLPGIVAVAVDAINPGTNRVATMTYDSGTFSISGLTDGTYYIYVESVDQDPSGGGSTQYYFANAEVPSYVALGGGGCIPTPAPAPIQSEFWNSSDAAGESPCFATAVTVSGGSTTNLGTIVTSSGTNLLRVQTPPFGMPVSGSPRGQHFSLPGGSAQTLGLYIATDFRYAGWYYEIQFAPTRGFVMASNGELDQVVQAGGAAVPSKITGFLDSSGAATASVAIGPSSLYMMLFAQAKFSPVSTAPPLLRSNCVTIWATN